jgi:hypothetical protein
MSQANVEFARSVFCRWNAGERRFPDDGILFEIRGGQLLRFETFLDEPADALKAAGLRD